MAVPTEPKAIAHQTVAAGWAEFARKILAPINVHKGSTQYTEMRRAFYAGAVQIFGVLLAIGHDEISEDQGETILENLSAEFDIYADDLKEGRA